MRGKILRMDKAATQEVLKNKDINYIKWVTAKTQTADYLKKKGEGSKKLTQSVFTCSKLTVEILEQCVKYIQS